MKAFIDLFQALDASNSTKTKVNLLADYFQRHPNSDGLWALGLLDEPPAIQCHRCGAHNSH